jgi:hypothetical protein
MGDCGIAGSLVLGGNHLLRWAAIEGVARDKGGDPIAPTYTRVARGRGRMIGRVAADASSSARRAFVLKESAWRRAAWRLRSGLGEHR